MTFSKDDLLANKALALQLIGQYCGSAAVDEECAKELPQFQPILATTWKALADDGFVRLSSIGHFRVTPRGALG